MPSGYLVILEALQPRLKSERSMAEASSQHFIDAAMALAPQIQAASAAKRAAELMFSTGGSASPYTSSGLERCVRAIHAAGQHITIALPNYWMAGLALLRSDMLAPPFFLLDR